MRVDFPVNAPGLKIEFLAECDARFLPAVVKLRARYRALVIEMAKDLGLTEEQAGCGCKDRIYVADNPHTLQL